MIDNIRFSEARIKVLAESGERAGIGTLGEKLLHRTLKLYFEPRREHHEVEYLGSIADIKNEEGVTEIQTRSFERLVPKLLKFLPRTPVTIIYPIISEKRLFWLDKETGELTAPRKSPKHGKPSDALHELSRLADFVAHKALTVKLVFISVDEYKLLDGWDKTGKRGAGCIERIPREITYIVTLRTLKDYAALIPDSLGNSFTAKEFNRATALRGRRAYFSLKFLLDKGLLVRSMGEKRAYIYKRM